MSTFSLDATGKVAPKTTIERHYYFHVGETKFGYCYLAKNGCTAFKNFITQTSRVRHKVNFDGTPIEYMGRYHKLHTNEDIEACDSMILVLRDPYDRLISAYTNKFISRRGTDIFKNYEEVTNKNPDDLTFRSFIVDYCKDFETRDHHVVPQAHYILPIQYDKTFMLADIYSEMSKIIPPEIADKYFKQKSNKENYGLTVSAAIDQRSEDLYILQTTHNSAPKKENFYDAELEEIVKIRYQDDYALIDMLK